MSIRSVAVICLILLTQAKEMIPGKREGYEENQEALTLIRSQASVMDVRSEQANGYYKAHAQTS